MDWLTGHLVYFSDSVILTPIGDTDLGMVGLVLNTSAIGLEVELYKHREVLYPEDARPKISYQWCDLEGMKFEKVSEDRL